MKVAVCLSGFPRLLDYSFPYLKKYILDPLNADIFYYGYSDIEHGIFEHNIIEKYKPKKYFIREFTSEVEEEIWQKYGTKQINNNLLIATTPINILSQYYNLFNCNNLKKEYEKENNIIYDCVIRARTDYYFFRKLEREELELSENKIYIPTLWDFGGVSSGFAYGRSLEMDKYSNLFNNIKEYNINEKVAFHPETLKAHHITKEQLIRQPIKNHYWWELRDFATNNNSDSYVEGLVESPSRREFK